VACRAAAESCDLASVRRVNQKTSLRSRKQHYARIGGRHGGLDQHKSLRPQFLWCLSDQGGRREDGEQ
jgi:hypothetical protein